MHIRLCLLQVRDSRLTANYDLAALSMFTTEEMSKFLPMGLKRLRGIRDGTLEELPRI